MVLVHKLAGQFVRIALVWSLALALPRAASAQIVTGSDGSDGPFTFVPDTPGGSTMTIDLALAASGLDGQGQPITWQTPSPFAGRGVYDPFAWAVVFKYSAIDVPSSKTVRFANHPSRAPVVWLCQSNAVLGGTLVLDGTRVGFYNLAVTWPEPGPGGFRGGAARSGIAFGPSGFGPGGGDGTGYNGADGNYGGAAALGYGLPYGSPAVFPLIGGSGAAANYGSSGFAGPGGGALLLAANQSVTLRSTSTISAYGGYASSGNQSYYRYGSGGGIRIVAHQFIQESGASLYASSWGGGSPGTGRTRIEANSTVGVLNGSPTPTFGLPGALLPDSTTPVVRVVTVTRGSQSYPVPTDPRASFSMPQADVVLTSPGTITVQIEARNVTPGATCNLRVVDAYGGASNHTSTPLAGTIALSTATATLTLPASLHALQVRVVL